MDQQTTNVKNLKPLSNIDPSNDSIFSQQQTYTKNKIEIQIGPVVPKSALALAL
jgi:hypothetical protein